jgi:hypothetical protein
MEPVIAIKYLTMHRRYLSDRKENSSPSPVPPWPKHREAALLQLMNFYAVELIITTIFIPPSWLPTSVLLLLSLLTLTNSKPGKAWDLGDDILRIRSVGQSNTISQSVDRDFIRHGWLECWSSYSQLLDGDGEAWPLGSMQTRRNDCLTFFVIG